MVRTMGAQRRSGQEQRGVAPRPPGPGQILWIDVQGPWHDELDRIVVAPFGVRPQTARLLEHPPQGSRFAVHDRYAFLHLAIPTGDGRDTPWLSVLLLHGVLVTVHRAPIDLVDEVYDSQGVGEELAQGPDILLAHLMERVVHRLGQFTLQLVDHTESVNNQVIRHPRGEIFHEIFRTRRQALDLRRSLTPVLDTLSFCSRPDLRVVDETARSYFEDLRDRLQDHLGEVDGVREGMSGSVEALASVQANQTNDVMKVLTLVSILFLPATTIASIYGMNFKIPELHWSFGYYYSLALMASTTAALLYWVKSKGWLRSRE